MDFCTALRRSASKALLEAEVAITTNAARVQKIIVPGEVLECISCSVLEWPDRSASLAKCYDNSYFRRRYVGLNLRISRRQSPWNTQEYAQALSDSGRQY